MKSTYPFVRSLNLRSFAPMSGRVTNAPCALQMASTQSTPLRIWKATTSFLGARAGIPPTTTCRCCARSVMQRSRIIDVLQLLTVGILGAEVVTIFLLEIRREYDRTNRIKEIPLMINEEISEVKIMLNTKPPARAITEVKFYTPVS